MAERVVRRLAAGGDGEDMRRAGEEWFKHRAAQRARAERLALIARLRAAEHRHDDAQVEAALEALRRGHDEQRAPAGEEEPGAPDAPARR